MTPVSHLVAAPTLSFLLFAAGAGTRVQETTPASPVAGVDAYRIELLDLAFGAATDMPTDPHIKTRCRLQERVARVCLELDLTDRALEYAARIRNWRRGLIYGEYAAIAAERGELATAERCLELAQQAADEVVADPSDQSWRAEQVHATIARTHTRLGNVDRAARLRAGIKDDDAGQLDIDRALQLEGDEVLEIIDAMTPVISAGSFESIRNALQMFVELLDRHFADDKIRVPLLKELFQPHPQIPLQVQVDFLLTASACAARHGDSRTAMTFVDEARDYVERDHWLPEHLVPMRARLAAARFIAGDRKAGRSGVDAALALFDEEAVKIVDIYKADALQPVAEAYAAIDEHAAALAVFKRAVSAAIENPNSRPRAEDLVAICCSLASRGIEPDADLRAMLEGACSQLGAPW